MTTDLHWLCDCERQNYPDRAAIKEVCKDSCPTNRATFWECHASSLVSLLCGQKQGGERGLWLDKTDMCARPPPVASDTSDPVTAAATVLIWHILADLKQDYDLRHTLTDPPLPLTFAWSSMIYHIWHPLSCICWRVELTQCILEWHQTIWWRWRVNIDFSLLWWFHTDMIQPLEFI